MLAQLPVAGAPGRTSPRHATACAPRRVSCASSGNGAGGVSGRSSSAQQSFAEEQSATAKLTQVHFLRRKAAEALAVQQELMAELQAQEARFQMLTQALGEARRGAEASGAALSEEQLVTDAVWGSGLSTVTTEVLRRDPWEESVGATPPQPTQAPQPPGVPPWASWLASLSRRAAASEAGSSTSSTEGTAPAPAPPPGPERVWSFFEKLASAASSTVARLRSPEFTVRDSQALRLRVKSDLLVRIAALDRGAGATTQDKLDVEAIVASLCTYNPTPNPSESSLSDGRWNIVYTTSPQMLGLGLPGLLRPSGPLYLTLNGAEGRAGLDATWPMKAERAVLAVTGRSGISLTFQSVKLFGFFTLPSSKPQREYSLLDTVYLDIDLRVMRGQAGTLFVAIMDDPFWKIADADRGVNRTSLPPGRAL